MEPRALDDNGLWWVSEPDDDGCCRTVEEGLYAQRLTAGWSVVDPQGGRWWPSDEAAAEIETAEDPAATAIRICEDAPHRGKWMD